jgi:Neuraminidase (sialidase)
MALMQSTDQGLSWNRAGIVGNFNWQFVGCPRIGGALAINENTIYSSVWTGLENKAGLYVLRSEDNGKNWTQPQSIGGMAAHNDIAAKNNEVIVIWDEKEPKGSGIFYAKSKDRGVSWSVATRLSPETEIATHPRIIPTSKGYLGMWTQKNTKKPVQLFVRFLE